MLRDFRKAGDVLNGRYLIEGILGKGGSSNVYFGKHIGLDMEVAIKEVSAEKLGKISAANEALLLKEIRHPALPNIMDIFEEDTYTYIIREYCRGEDIRKNILHSGPYSIEKCKLIVQGLSSVLEFLHSQNPPLIYRDLKPSNVIIDEHNNIKLIDFGISRKFDEDKKDDTQYMGSRKYAAPEQFGLGQSSPRTDIYSLGMLLYFLYVGEDYCELDEEERWLKFRNEREVHLKEAIRKAISFRPEDRQESTLHFLGEAFPPEKPEELPSEETELLPEAFIPPLRLSRAESLDDREEAPYVVIDTIQNKETRRPILPKIRDKVHMGFFGLKSAVGVSHIALATALACSRRGYRTLLAERALLPGYSLLSSFVNNEDVNEETRLTTLKLDKLRINLANSERNLPSLLSEPYDVIIFDFGSRVNALGDFLRLPYKNLILPSAPYAYNKNFEIIEEMRQYRDVNYIINLANPRTEQLLKWLDLNKAPHLKLGYLDYEVENEETVKLLTFLNFEEMSKKRRGLLGRLLK